MKTAGLAVSLIIVAAVVGIVLLNLLESSGDDSKLNRTLNDTSQPFPAPTATLATAPELETTSQPVFSPSSPRQGGQLLDELPAALAAVPVPLSLDGEEASSPSTPDIDTTESEVQIRVNSFRGEQGLTQLALNALLVEVARAHSKDMAQRKFFDHYTPEGLGPQGPGRAGWHNRFALCREPLSGPKRPRDLVRIHLERVLQRLGKQPQPLR